MHEDIINLIQHIFFLKEGGEIAATCKNRQELCKRKV